MTLSSHSGDYEDGRLLGCSAVWTGMSLPAFIALMMEAASASETLVNLYQSTRRYNPEDSHLWPTTAVQMSAKRTNCVDRHAGLLQCTVSWWVAEVADIDARNLIGTLFTVRRFGAGTAMRTSSDVRLALLQQGDVTQRAELKKTVLTVFRSVLRGSTLPLCDLSF
jgi:hypothetical protein